MSGQTRTVLEAALSLPSDQRATVAEALLESLTEDEDEMVENKLLAELDRRRADVAQGGATIPWSVLWDEE